MELQNYIAMSDKQLAVEYFKLSKEERRELYAQLPIEKQANLRPIVESQRGITRNSLGKIIHTDEWVAARIEALSTKKDLYTERSAVIDAEILNLKAEQQESEDIKAAAEEVA